jgi:hypothetical protein
MATKIQVRRDTSANWTSLNPTLSSGEIGFETNTGKFKIGNGSTLWSALDYFLDSSDLSGYLTAASASTTYLTQASASTTYLTQSSASTTYLTQTSASTIYQPKVENVDNTEIGYLNNASANIQTQLNTLTSNVNLKAPLIPTTNSQTGTTYTLVSEDLGKHVTMTNASSMTLTIAPNSSLNFSVGAQVTVSNLSTVRNVSIVGGSGVTFVNSFDKFIPFESSVILTMTAVDVWLVSPMVASGLVPIASGSFGGNSSITFLNCFSSQYRNYTIEVMIESVASTMAGGGLTFQLLAGGTPAGSNYSYHLNWAYGYGSTPSFKSFAASSGGGSGFALTSTQAAYPYFVRWDIANPWLSISTFGMSRAYGATADATESIFNGGFRHSLTASYDGCLISSNGPTMNGAVRIYGNRF